MTMPHRALIQRVAAHLNTTASLDSLGMPTMPCPTCGGDYGPTVSVDFLSVFELGYLPGAPLLVGVCLDCGLIFEPNAVDVGQG